MTTRIHHTLKLMALALVLCLLPLNMALADVTPQDKKVDANTMNNWRNLFDNQHTGYAGSVWTDKSVFNDGAAFSDVNRLPDDSPVTISVDEDHFLVALSAMASTMEVVGYSTTPTDTMLVLDVSGSMVGSTSTVGYRGSDGSSPVYGLNNSSTTATVQAMVDSANAAIDELLKLNRHNRVGLVLYSGGGAGNATLLLPLGRYSDVNGEYVDMQRVNTSEQLYQRDGNSYRLRNVSYSYVSVGTVSGLTAEDGGAVQAVSRRVEDATYIQSGLFVAWGEFEKRIAANDTAVEQSLIQGGTRRVPIMVLMSDGAPTKGTTSYAAVGDANAGDGRTGDATASIGFVTQLTASWIRTQMQAGYGSTPLFYTLGLGQGSTHETAVGVLNPSSANNNAAQAWNSFINNGSVSLTFPRESLNEDGESYNETINREAGVSFVRNYVDRYWAASNADQMIAAFTQIVEEILLQSRYYATLITSGDRDVDGYVTIEDELGEFMEVKRVIGLTIGDTLYSGAEMAKAMGDGSLGTAGSSTELGDELIWTVQERLGIDSVTEARAVVGQAYEYHQLYPGDDVYPPSNYIGWYGDANNGYLAHWHEGHTERDYPQGAAYINRSYGYLGEEMGSDMMHIVVMVRTNIETGQKSVQYRIPASLIPLVTYSVTVDSDSFATAQNITLTQDADSIRPVRLLLEVGLSDEINEVTLAEVMAGHDHTHPADGGAFSFYSNRWGADQDDDPTQHLVTVAHFTPSEESEYYYFSENEQVLDANGNPVPYSQVQEGGDYYYYRWAIRNTPDSGDGNAAYMDNVLLHIDSLDVRNFKADADGNAYIPAGSYNAPSLEMVLAKAENITGTLDYVFFSRGFTGGSAEEFVIYDYLGNNGTFKLTPATGLKLTKTVAEQADGAETSFDFTIRLNQAAGENVAVTDADGNAVSGWSVSADRTEIYVTLTDGQTVCIIGLPAGATYRVEEAPSQHYAVVIDKPEGVLVNQQLTAVSAVNSPNLYGSLIIEKDVENHPFGGNLSNVFDFTATLTGLTAEEAEAVTVPTGAVKVYDAAGQQLVISGIAVKDDDSVTLGNIPTGTEYKVVELPEAGFAQNVESSVATEGTIAGTAAVVAQFVNDYVPASLTPAITVGGTKTLTANAGSVTETFHFKVLRYDPDTQGFVDVSGATASVTLSAAANSVAQAFTIDLNETFTEVGTYYYRIVEVAGENGKMQYDASLGRFRVDVTDENVDGTLEATVSAIEDTVSVSQDGLTVTKDFVNTYEAEGARVLIDFTKTLSNAVGGYDIPLNTFHFELKDADGNVVQTVSTDVSGAGQIILDIEHEGTQTYTLTEVNGGAAGMTYDARVYTIVVTTVDNGGTLEATVAVSLSGEPVTDVTFANSFDLDPVSMAIPASKTLTNVLVSPNAPMAFADGEFALEYAPANDLYEATGAWTEVAFDASGSATIPLLTDCKAAGTYRFVVREKAGSRPGITYDAAVWHVTAVVAVDAENGRLTASYSLNKQGGGSEQAIAFANTYQLDATVSLPVGGTKILTGRTLIVGEFTFELLDESGEVIRTATNHADGSFAFEALTFTAADLGAHTYTVREQIPADEADRLGGVTYTDMVYTFTVDVADVGDGTLSATVRDLKAGESLNFPFYNEYKTTPVTVRFGGVKTLTGRTLQDAEFAFDLIDADSGEIIETVRNSGGSFAFSPLTYTYTDENNHDMGTHNYIIRESIPEDAQKLPGVTYDASTYEIAVHVSDLHGTMSARVEMVKPGVGTVDSIAFENQYALEGTEVQLGGTKTLTGRALADGEFAFELVDADSGEVIETVRNVGGRFAFSPLPYGYTDEASNDIGTHSYIIREQLPDEAQRLPGVSYDSTSYRVEVTVREQDGVLIAETVITRPDGTVIGTGDIAFQNAYNPGAVAVQLEADKTMTGKQMDGEVFTFHVLENGSVVATGSNDENGRIVFTPITIAAAGVYTYTVAEVIPQGAVLIDGAYVKDQIAYDSTVFTVTVTVTDDGRAQLTAQVVYSAPVVFTNVWRPAPIPVTLQGVKELIGRDMLGGEFRFIVYDGNGMRVASGYSDKDGNIIFTPAVISAEGRYVYTIVEEQGVIEGVTYDDRSFTVTVDVVNDNGILKATVAYPEGGVEFKNIYTPTLPLTGDDSGIGLWLALALVSLTGIAVILTAGRRRGRI